MSPSFAESLERAADVLRRVREWELPQDSWHRGDGAVGALEHAVLSGEAHRVLLAVSRVELSGVMRSAPPMADGSAAVEDRRIPELVNKTVNRIGVVVERARDAGAGKQRRDP